MTIDAQAEEIATTLAGVKGFSQETHSRVINSARSLIESGWCKEQTEQYLAYILTNNREEKQ